MATSKRALRFATRPSALARWQTEFVMRSLQAAWPSLACSEMIVTTTGDRILDRPLPEIGGKGLFTQELEAALLSGQVDAAVHSLKDLPVENPPGLQDNGIPSLVVGATPLRADPRDVLISASGLTLQQLPAGARVGTSSLRRAAQLLRQRPDLQIEALRGNVDTRVRKAKEGRYDAIVLAGAGVSRLGLEEEVTEWLSLDWMLPAPGQGALAVQCRAGDGATLKLLSSLEDTPTRLATTAERAFLAGLGGGCALPVAAYARVEAGRILLDGMAASPDGRSLRREQAVGEDPQQVGVELADRLLAQGVGEFLHGVA